MRNFISKHWEKIFWGLFFIFTIISLSYLIEGEFGLFLTLFIPTLLLLCPKVIRKYKLKKSTISVFAAIGIVLAFGYSSNSMAEVKKQKQVEQKQKQEAEEKERKAEEERKKAEKQKRELKDRKDKVKREISAYANISQEDKDNLVKKVDEASENSKVDEIKEEAERLDKKNRDKKEQESKDSSSEQNASSSLTSGSQSTQSSTPTSTGQGIIKGNKNSKIYHLPGQRDYDKISPKNVIYFNSEAEAQAAGYRVAKR